MTTEAIHAFGTLLKRGNGAAPEVFTAIAEVRDIRGPRLRADTKDVTTHESPGGWEEVIPLVKRSGEITFDVNFLPASASHNVDAGLLKDYDDKTLRNFQLVFPDDAGTTWEFAAYVTGFEPSEPVDAELSASVTLKISGEPILA